MTEKKGSFDAAIDVLEYELNEIEDLSEQERFDIGVAVHILKVAGKVDKAIAIEHFHIQVCPEWEAGKRERIRVGVLAGCPKCVVIDNLLEALPEDKKEKR